MPAHTLARRHETTDKGRDQPTLDSDDILGDKPDGCAHLSRNADADRDTNARSFVILPSMSIVYSIFTVTVQVIAVSSSSSRDSRLVISAVGVLSIELGLVRLPPQLSVGFGVRVCDYASRH